MQLENRVAIITGSGRGIGRVAALQLAAEGAAVVLASRTLAEVESAARDIRAEGGKAVAVETDISRPEEAKRMVERAIEEFGQLDVLINNAAMPGPVKELTDLDFEDWDFVYGINVRGTMACCKYALQHMVPRKTGNIINVSSTAGRRGMSGRVHYCSSKAAIMGITRALAEEVGKYNIRVNCIVPGAIFTELLDRLIAREAGQEGISYDEKKAAYASNSPMGRIVEPSEVASMMLYLASDQSRGVHGQSIDVNAGSWMG